MAGAASEVYEPLNQYKPVARNIGIVDGPFEYLTMAGVRLPFRVGLRVGGVFDRTQRGIERAAAVGHGLLALTTEPADHAHAFPVA
jgi:hypothetical protein